MNFIKELLNWLKNKNKKFYLYDEVDDRNFGSDALYKPVKEDLVDEYFMVFDPTPQNQYDSDFCAGYSGAYAAEATEHEPLSGAFLFAKAKELTGEWSSWGTSIRQICKDRNKFGICSKKLYDYAWGKRDRFANWNNITAEAVKDAEKHKSQSYFQVVKPWGWDLYDTIRAYLWHFKDQNILINTGRDAHAATIIGYDPNRGLVGRDSYNGETYEKGLRYFDRNFANGLFTPYFSWDMPRNLAELLVQFNNKAIKLTDNEDCYLVKNGQKHLLKNEAIAWANGTLLFDPNFVTAVLKEDFDKIPTGEPAKFEEGEYWQIVKRILEKVDKLDLISEK
jgi:hypothetical protein